jgi:hypothetical protein
MVIKYSYPSFQEEFIVLQRSIEWSCVN